jgi:aldose 1-epimerase
MDFRTAKLIGKDIDADYEPLRQAGGFDHNYVLNTNREEPSCVAELIDDASGRKMEVFTDLPGMQFYAGNFIGGNLKGKGGYVYQKRDGVCFESQFYPNSCNTEGFPSTVLKAGEEFSSVTVYKFSIA